MKKTSLTTRSASLILALVLSLGTLPLLVGVTGCTTTSQTDGERREDLGTSSRVRAAMAEDTQYKFDGVNVSTFAGRVRLTGFVNSRDQRDRAETLAGRVDGVREIKNDIRVKEPAR